MPTSVSNGYYMCGDHMCDDEIVMQPLKDSAGELPIT